MKGGEVLSVQQTSLPQIQAHRRKRWRWEIKISVTEGSYGKSFKQRNDLEHSLPTDINTLTKIDFITCTVTVANGLRLAFTLGSTES
jgi:hypothetical protein